MVDSETTCLLAFTEVTSEGAAPSLPRSCVVTKLQHAKLKKAFAVQRAAPSSSEPGNVGDKSEWEWYWYPRFWQQDTVSATLRVLMRGVDNPTIWLFGEYEAMELATLEERGLLPRGVRRVPPPPKFSHTPVILRFDSVEQIIMPCQQGLGHMPGARIAVFEGAAQPLGLYDEWLGAARQGSVDRFGSLFTADETPIDNAAAWISPFGSESREHALITKADVESLLLADNIALALNLPLLVSRCHPDEYWDWDWDQTLPVDLRPLLSAHG